MGYALFAQKKLTLYGLINSVQMQQSQRADEQMALSTRTLTLQASISNIQSSQSAELGVLHNALAAADDSETRQDITDEIDSKQCFFEGEIAKINNQIYQTSNKENVIEMEVKRLDTKLTAMQKQVEKIEEAESNGIDKSTPKFKGVG